MENLLPSPNGMLVVSNVHFLSCNVFIEANFRSKHNVYDVNDAQHHLRYKSEPV